MYACMYECLCNDWYTNIHVAIHFELQTINIKVTSTDMDISGYMGYFIPEICKIMQ